MICSITDAPNSCFIYDTNNRLISHNGYNISYDMDGNMLNNGYFKYDSANRLIKATDLTYTYNAEDVRIRSFGEYVDTTYTYNTNCKLSQLLTKTTNGITTKYVYGLGLIGEEKECCFKTYHFDYRGSTVAITDECGNIIDTLKYDTYGNVTEHIGDSYVIFGHNGRDGVVTDRNGLLYMRARYYSPAIRRFINADILHGEISDSTSLNRYSYVNGNPVSFVDPFGLSAIIITADHAAKGFGHTSIIVEDERSDTWHYFYWGDKAAYFTEVPIVANNIDSLEDFNNWLNKQDLPYSTKNYTSSIYVEGNFNASVDYYSELVENTVIETGWKYKASVYDKPTYNYYRKNISYNLLKANCLQKTLVGFKKGVLSDGTSMAAIIQDEFESNIYADLVPNVAEYQFYDVFLNRAFTKYEAIKDIREAFMYRMMFTNTNNESRVK